MAKASFYMQENVAPKSPQSTATDFHFYQFDLALHHLELHWLRDGQMMDGKSTAIKPQSYQSIAKLKDELHAQNIDPIFMSNAGIFEKGGTDIIGNRPMGVFIKDGKVLSALDLAKGTGNFYWHSAVFHIETNGAGDEQAFITPRALWVNMMTFQDGQYHGAFGQVTQAFQSGPLLMRDHQRSSAGQSASDGYARSAIGIMDNGKIIIAHTASPMAYRDFVSHIEQSTAKPDQLRDLLFLDGTINDFWVKNMDKSNMRNPMRGYPSLGAFIVITTKDHTD